MTKYHKVVGKILEEDEVQGRYIREEVHENIIVLTEDELRDAWKVAQFHQRQGNSGFTFDDYLACKGITLQPH